MTYLDAVLKEIMKNVRPTLHHSHIFPSGIAMLPVLDRVHEAIGEFFHRSQEIGFYELDHVIIFLQVILQRCPREDDAPACSNLI